MKNERMSQVRTHLCSDVNEESRHDWSFDVNEILIEHHKLKSSKLHLILESINKYKCLQCSNEIEEFKKYIIAYIHVKSGLENSLDLCYEPEITFATFSVFPSSKFTEFCSLDLQEKAVALNELADIVTGIILFNKEFEHEQEFGNLKSVLHDALLIMSKKVDDKMLSAQNDLEKYIEIYRKCLQLQQEGDLPEDISLYVLEDFVLNTIQYKYFVHQLGNDVSLCARRVQDKIEYFNLHIENFIKSDQLSEDNGPRSSSSVLQGYLIIDVEPATKYNNNNENKERDTLTYTRKIYITEMAQNIYTVPPLLKPNVFQFIQLAQIWDVLKEEVIVLSQCIFVLCNLQLYKQAPENVFSEEKFDKFLQNENALYKINSDKPVIKEILQSNSLKLIQTESVVAICFFQDYKFAGSVHKIFEQSKRYVRKLNEKTTSMNAAANSEEVHILDRFQPDLLSIMNIKVII
ncbi:Cilia- and flagella-associated protein 206 [Nymphon striatum]|nr:Cilia- and flagella-associated protein 206 [Nymphon striatum]